MPCKKSYYRRKYTVKGDVLAKSFLRKRNAIFLRYVKVMNECRPLRHHKFTSPIKRVILFYRIFVDLRKITMILSIIADGMDQNATST